MLLWTTLIAWLESFSAFVREWFAWIGLCLMIALFTGCSIQTWDTDVTDGKHDTTWNWGLEVGSTFYIGPGKGSVTHVENKFVGKAEGIGNVEVAETPASE